MKASDLKKLLLAGTALVAVGSFSPAAKAADDEVTTGTTLLSTMTSGTDSIVDLADGADSETYDLNGASFTAGTDGAAEGIESDATGGTDASSIFITNTSATAATFTTVDDAGGAAISMLGGTTA
ncbi:MAG: hypothetical protein K9G62_07930, partial [Alphaproteobacteria bacterium]|nr:hypothetical protein [Alphaproteobacteria bacterium]